MSAEAWIGIAAIVASVLAGAGAIVWRMSRLETKVDDIGPRNEAEHGKLWTAHGDLTRTVTKQGERITRNESRIDGLQSR